MSADEIAFLEGMTIVYKNSIDLFFYVVGSAQENEVLSFLFFFFLTDVHKTAAKSLDIISFKNSQWSSWCIPQPITRGQWPHFAVIFLSQPEGYCSLHHLQCDLESIGSLTLVVKSSWCLITTFQSGRASPASKREVAAFRENWLFLTVSVKNDFEWHFDKNVTFLHVDLCFLLFLLYSTAVIDYLLKGCSEMKTKIALFDFVMMSFCFFFTQFSWCWCRYWTACLSPSVRSSGESFQTISLAFENNLNCFRLLLDCWHVSHDARISNVPSVHPRVSAGCTLSCRAAVISWKKPCFSKRGICEMPHCTADLCQSF